jgi:molybdenum cofactor biosynthesis enzyme MoaA
MENKFIDKNDIWALSITITGKCNAYCDYCHFYARKDRKEKNIISILMRKFLRSMCS